MATMPAIDQSSEAPIAPEHFERPRRMPVPIGTIVQYAALIMLSLLFLFPFYLMIRNALMTQPEITGDWSWWPAKAQWHNFSDLFNTEAAAGSMSTGLRNSTIIAVSNLLFQTIFAAMAGYGLARIPFRGKEIVFFIILSTLMIPSAVTFVPSYVVISKLGGVNTLWGIVVPGLFSAFATFLFRQFYLDFPVEIEEAGRVDGLGYWGIFWRLLLPNSWGIMAALGILSFIYSWNAFLWPVIIGQNVDSYTVQVVVSRFLNAQRINIPALFAAACVGAAPLVVVFLVLQRYIVQGVRLSGIKG